ncbi:MAG: ABC transporter permease [Acidobacteriota bacterium]
MSGLLSDLWHDLRHAAGSLRRHAGFSATVIVTLAVGIGVNTAMFSIVDNVLLRPLGYPESDRLQTLTIRTPQRSVSTYGFGDGEFEALARDAKSFELMGRYDYGGGTLSGDGGPPEEPTSLGIDLGLQEILGLTPLMGRRFSQDDYTDGADRVVMLGEEIWRRRYGADPELVGRTVLLDESAHVVVGIVPDVLRFPDESEPIQVWRVRRLSPTPRMGWGSLGVVGRLAPGVTDEQADSELEALAAGMATEHPDTNTDRSFASQSMQETAVGSVQDTLFLLWGAVGFVLLLACMNSANLLLARAASKAHEFAVCSAIGASPRRVMQRVLSESVLLSLVAGLAGLLVAQWTIEGAALFGLQGLPRAQEIGLDGRIFGFTVVLATLAGLAYGLLPAWQLGRLDLSEMMKDGGTRVSMGPVGQKIRSALTIGEVAVACVLLIGAGLTIRSSREIRATDPGFDHQNMLGLTLWADRPRGADAGWNERFFDGLMERISAVPGVETVSIINGMPWQSMFDYSTNVVIADHPSFESGEPAQTKFRVVSEGYLADMDIPLLAGRQFTTADDRDAPAVTIVSEELAALYWPDTEPVGQRIQVGENDVEIIGMVGGIRERRLDREPVPMLYFPYRQNADIAMTLMVRTDREPTLVERPVQDAIWAESPNQGIWRTTTLDSLLAGTLVRERLYSTLLTAFALVAVLLAATGVYGVMSFAVTQRTQEIGIRMALGATTPSVCWSVVSGGLRLAALGLVIGLPIAWLTSRWLTDVLYQVTGLDPVTHAAVAVLMVLVAGAACFLPAWRATRVEPAACLRVD